MADPYMSEIEVFAFNFAPKNWMQCAGQLLPIAQYQALFSLLGVMYGGDGIRTFALPDLRGRLAIGFGDGPNLSSYDQGEQTGQESVTLLISNMPAGPHTHMITASNVTSGGTNVPSPTVGLSAGYTTGNPPTNVEIYSTATPTVAMRPLVPVGGQPHDNHMPYLTLNYCICIAGIFPSRN